MAGSVHLNTPSYLPTLLGSGSRGTSLLATLDGYAGSAPGPVGPRGAPEQAQTNEARQVALVAAQPQVQRDIARFAQAVMTARTPAQLLGDPVALKVLLTANGLADQVGDAALATRALLSNPAQSTSLINTLADPRWLDANKTYSFATMGLSVLNNPRTIAAISSLYAEVLWRTGQPIGATAPDLSPPLEQPMGLVV